MFFSFGASPARRLRHARVVNVIAVQDELLRCRGARQCLAQQLHLRVAPAELAERQLLRLIERQLEQCGRHLCFLRVGLRLGWRRPRGGGLREGECSCTEQRGTATNSPVL